MDGVKEKKCKSSKWLQGNKNINFGSSDVPIHSWLAVPKTGAWISTQNCSQSAIKSKTQGVTAVQPHNSPWAQEQQLPCWNVQVTGGHFCRNTAKVRVLHSTSKEGSFQLWETQVQLYGLSKATQDGALGTLHSYSKFCRRQRIQWWKTDLIVQTSLSKTKETSV